MTANSNDEPGPRDAEAQPDEQANQLPTGVPVGERRLREWTVHDATGAVVAPEAVATIVEMRLVLEGADAARPEAAPHYATTPGIERLEGRADSPVTADLVDYLLERHDAGEPLGAPGSITGRDGGAS